MNENCTAPLNSDFIKTKNLIVEVDQSSTLGYQKKICILCNYVHGAFQSNVWNISQSGKPGAVPKCSETTTFR
jgi:hypothetical protein